MSRLENALDAPSDERAAARGGVERLLVPAVIATLAVATALAIIVSASVSAWELLGVGRGLVSPHYFYLSGFVIVLATTLGQAAGWAAGSAFLYYLMTATGFPSGFRSARVAMSLVYVGLGAAPLTVYHALYGGPLLGLPRLGLAEWLATQYPDAHWLLITAHPFVDGSVIVFGVVFFWLLWGTADAPRRHRGIQTGIAVALLATSLAVALSLGIHSTLAHVKIFQ